MVEDGFDLVLADYGHMGHFNSSMFSPWWAHRRPVGLARAAVKFSHPAPSAWPSQGGSWGRHFVG